MRFAGADLEVGDVAVTWARLHTDRRRAVLGMRHPDALALFSRLPGVRVHLPNVRAALSRLAEPGRPIIVRTPAAVIGLVRVFRVPGELSGEPVLLDCGPVGTLRTPVVCTDVEHARTLARCGNTAASRKLPWHIYPAEIAQPSLSADGPARTELENVASGRTGAPRRGR